MMSKRFMISVAAIALIAVLARPCAGNRNEGRFRWSCDATQRAGWRRCRAGRPWLCATVGRDR